MTSFVLAGLLLGLLAVAVLTRPWWRASARWRIGAVGAFVAAVALAGAWMLRPAPVHHAADGHDHAHAPAKPRAAASSAEAERAAAQVAELAGRVQSRPDDADGWLLLARAQVALARHAEAAASFRKAVALRAPDAGVLADMAYAVAMAQGRRLDGEPAALIERALAIDAEHPKALGLAGTAAFDRQDYAGALKHWETLARLQPADGVVLQQLQVSMAEARRLGALQAQRATLPVAAASAPAAQVSGTVRLSDGFKSRVSPEDTVFVFARAVDDPKMPLAILRKQVKDLPLKFTLDDAMAMSPAATLSGAKQVVVGARVSKSGKAMAQPGDFHGISKPVAVGAAAIDIVIDQEVGR